MRAAVIEAFGPPEVLRVAELPNPKASHNQLLIRVSACGVNRRDTWVRAGLRSQSLPRILGCDIAGTVVAAGPGSRQERIGESVVVYPIVSCGWCSHCITGNDQLCASAGLLGAEADGGYCELIAVDESRVFPAPPSLDPMQAAALPIVYTTAWQMIRRTRIAPGETVLIWGASSGLGRAALELTRLVNPGRTFTTARRDKVDRAAGLGADAVIAYDREPVAERILELDGRTRRRCHRRPRRKRSVACQSGRGSSRCEDRSRRGDHRRRRFSRAAAVPLQRPRDPRMLRRLATGFHPGSEARRRRPHRSGGRVHSARGSR